MEKTLSKYFYDSEIKGVMIINGRKVIYLKSYVKRLWRYNDHLLEDNMDHINHQLIKKEKIQQFYTKIVGSDDSLEE